MPAWAERSRGTMGYYPPPGSEWRLVRLPDGPHPCRTIHRLPPCFQREDLTDDTKRTCVFEIQSAAKANSGARLLVGKAGSRPGLSLEVGGGQLGHVVINWPIGLAFIWRPRSARSSGRWSSGGFRVPNRLRGAVGPPGQSASNQTADAAPCGKTHRAAGRGNGRFPFPASAGMGRYANRRTDASRSHCRVLAAEIKPVMSLRATTP